MEEKEGRSYWGKPTILNLLPCLAPQAGEEVGMFTRLLTSLLYGVMSGYLPGILQRTGMVPEKRRTLLTPTLMQQAGNTKAERQLPHAHKRKFTGRNIKELIRPQATD